MFTEKKIKKINPFFKIFNFILILLIIIWYFIYSWYIDFKTNILVEKEIIIEIVKWEINSDIANKININKNYLKYYLKENEPDFELIVWKFKIEKESDIVNILKALKNPIIEDEINITILEWWNIFDIDNYLVSKKLIEIWTYIEYVENKEKISKLTEFFAFIKWLETLEWFLYPDTYSVKNNENFKINVFVIKQLENFENKVINELFKNPIWQKKETNILEIITLASIVEKEEKSLEAKSTVAWILKKRLNEWWKIWADITVCYPHKLTAEECKMVITKYINEKSEYNTRTMTWLPKTPIWNSSFETINATINSKKTQYYFYLHDTQTGKIYYWKNNSEHEKNKRLYLR